MESDLSDCEFVQMTCYTKKRQKHGRLRDVNKKMKLQSHEIGRECNCKRLECSKKIPAEGKQNIIRSFNLLESTDKQNSYLCGLISIVPVKNRRPRLDEENARLRDVVALYKIRYLYENKLTELEVCRDEFIALHGITKRRIEYLLTSLKNTGMSPVDKRGKHSRRPLKLSDDTCNKIAEHISSFKGRGSHYSTKDSQKKYLPEDLNIKKMWEMFKKLHPGNEVSYESYRTIFNRDFNIAFGYPRTDTCSTCDEYLAKMKCLEYEKEKSSEKPVHTSPNKKQKISRSMEDIAAEIKQLTTSHDLHLCKAKSFYSIKKQSKLSSRKSNVRESICIDFGKNFPIPKIPTNDVYYKRQLSIYMFNIHVLSDSRSVFYVYPETIAKKGSDDVSSLMNHFVYNWLDSNIRDLDLFCDSCGGQNKNYTFLRYLHNLVHHQKRFDSVRVTFPIRGHSYMENDKNMGIINQKARVETVKELCDLVKFSRKKPSPFVVEHLSEDNQNIFQKWTEHLNKFYKKKATFPIQPIRQFQVSKEHPRLIKYRNTYNGTWTSAVVSDRKPIVLKHLERNNQFLLPEISYTGKLKLIILLVSLLNFSYSLQVQYQFRRQNLTICRV